MAASFNTKSGQEEPNAVDELSLQFGVKVDELKKLMELRGIDGVEAIKEQFNGVLGLCRRLKTDPVKG